HSLNKYTKLAIGDLVTTERGSLEGLDKNAEILAKASFWATFGNSNRMSLNNFIVDDVANAGEVSSQDNQAPRISIENDPTRFLGLYDVATGLQTNIDEFGVEGTASAWQNLRILFILNEQVIVEKNLLRIPVALGDRDWAYLALPRSVELEKLLQRIKSEGIIANKKLAVVELRGRDTFDNDPGISD
ncbi:hypothetical protein HDU96_005274, partial [Phlyctochytrium bullatum]